MKNRNLKAVKTEDNSYTLFYPELNEHYHSMDGAQSESEYVYIQNGLERLDKKLNSISVFEIGFGSGMNAVLAYEWALKNNKSINYFALEPYPVENEILAFLLKNNLLFKRNSDVFNKMHAAKQNDIIAFEDLFRFQLVNEKIEEFEILSLKEHVDIIFYDAFAPSRQSDIWSLSNLTKAFELLKNKGILVSYCASGQYKRHLRSAGFDLIKEKGFGKKREMFLGQKQL
ncbi:tRNA (5-methylaminomethyl-2-thiouridine)(34)-methyltransferase MnmD [Hyphobacterium sp. CCMP332]|nr:tRNA (5-methylaminomethyl-2-thiouridine)(34)-methyltransferase MnmD [Hyphobacterium sp. CCMP332]